VTIRQSYLRETVGLGTSAKSSGTTILRMPGRSPGFAMIIRSENDEMMPLVSDVGREISRETYFSET
jgi:hypothetical protein